MLTYTGVCVCRPTVEARQALYAAAHRYSEDIRMQIRKARDVVVKPFKKHEPEYEEVSLSV